MRNGIFRFGDYGWLGEYRAKSIISAASKLKPEMKLDPLVALDTFHSCYLLNTKLVDTPNQLLVQLTEPILRDEELREITVADDLISRVFAVKYLIALQQKMREMRAEGQGDRAAAASALAAALSGSSNGEEVKDAITAAVAEAAEEAKEEAKKYTMNTKAYAGLKAGVGHAVTFGELLNLEFTVDVRELLKLFRDISIELEKSKTSSPFGAYEGVKFGRDLSKLTPTALALPEELFWYRYATSTLPLVDTKAAEVERFILVVDKSGSMAYESKTLWSRAVALALARQAKKGSIKAKLMWFDYKPFGLTDLHREFDEALKMILTLRCDGGTDIDRALREADKHGCTIILVTDGEDDVDYEPENRLISVMVKGRNEALRKVSDEYLVVRPTRRGALKLFNALRK